VTIVRSRLTFANVASAMALFISLGGGAYAATNSAIGTDGTIRACLTTSGSVRIPAGKHSCNRHETAIAWNRTGPAGMTGATGATGERGPAGKDIDASNHYTKAETDARYLAATGKAADADKLDGADLADLAIAGDLLFARVASNGTTVSGSRPAGVTAVALTANASRVTFARNVAGCAFSAIEADGSPSGETIAVSPAGGGSVDVTFQTTLHAFHLQAIC
jgi:hypothetical protein